MTARIGLRHNLAHPFAGEAEFIADTLEVGSASSVKSIMTRDDAGSFYPLEEHRRALFQEAAWKFHPRLCAAQHAGRFAWSKGSLIGMGSEVDGWAQ